MKIATSQYEMYTDQELLPGAKQNGLSVAGERERLRLVQMDFRQWPEALKIYLRTNQHEMFCFDNMQKAVVTWLKTEQGFAFDHTVKVFSRYDFETEDAFADVA